MFRECAEVMPSSAQPGEESVALVVALLCIVAGNPICLCRLAATMLLLIACHGVVTVTG